MKKISWVLFISYLVVFTGVGVFIYFKIIDKYFTTGAESIEPEKTSQTGYIYYSQESNLFRINPALDVDLATQRIERFQSTGAVNNLSVKNILSPIEFLLMVKKLPTIQKKIIAGRFGRLIYPAISRKKSLV